MRLCYWVALRCAAYDPPASSNGFSPASAEQALRLSFSRIQQDTHHDGTRRRQHDTLLYKELIFFCSQSRLLRNPVSNQ